MDFSALMDISEHFRHLRDQDAEDDGNEELPFQYDFQAAIYKHCLSTSGPVEFAISNVIPSFPLPGIVIPEFGVLPLPLTEANAKQLQSSLQQAPHGRGTETVLDLNVRNCWQLEPAKFRIENPAFHQQVTELVKTARDRLGIQLSSVVVGELYKLLIYPPGGHFEPHRDTEKVKGMFGSLIIQLPSIFEGGKLTVTHKGETVEMGGESKDNMNTQYCAFYAKTT